MSRISYRVLTFVFFLGGGGEAGGGGSANLKGGTNSKF